MTFGEFMVVLVVGIVVFGPKELPVMLRKLGQWAAKLRRVAADLRAQSGIDDVLRADGLADDIREIRKLARGELDGMSKTMSLDAPEPVDRKNHQREVKQLEEAILREREYPADGVDAYGAIPDDADLYEELPPSALADDPLYARGVRLTVVTTTPEADA